MKSVYIGLFSLFLLSSSAVFSQKSSTAKPIIVIKSIGEYHDLTKLQNMTKGQLIPLYKERIKVLFNFFPYIGITPKPGFSFLDLGIPSTKSNNSILDQEMESKNEFIQNNEKFLDAILPYSDTANIINGILYFEDILKNLNGAQYSK